jgi:formate dehydrogenase subunit delta
MAEDLIRMANQIAANFRSHPTEEAITGIASHLKSFWEPRMLANLRTAIADGRADGLDPRVTQALNHP